MSPIPVSGRVALRLLLLLALGGCVSERQGVVPLELPDQALEALEAPADLAEALDAAQAPDLAPPVDLAQAPDLAFPGGCGSLHALCCPPLGACDPGLTCKMIAGQDGPTYRCWSF